MARSTKVALNLTGFLAGELDPLLDSRVDTEQYAFGLKLCENFVPVNEGPLIKRPGFEYIRPAASTASWLSAFRFSIQQEYAIEWSNLAARFYTNGGRIESDPVTPYQVTTPYTAAQARQLSFQQSFDRLYIDHPAHPPSALRRDTATTFTHEVLELLNGPFADGNIVEADELTLTGTLTVGGSVTVTGPGGFTADHVGALLRVDCEDFSTIKAWEPQMDGVAIGDHCRSDGKVYRAQTAGATGTYQPTHTSGSEWDGLGKSDVLNAKGPYGVQWLYVHDLFGIVKITGYTSATSVTADVVRRLPATVSPMTSWRWAHGLFSKAAGWPSLVALCWGRMVHFKDFDVVASVAGDFGGGKVNFSTHSDSGLLTADLAFRRRLQGEDPPHWVAVDRRLLAGTATREISIAPLNEQQAISGENITADPQSFYGSQAIPPVQAGTETMFIERGGRRIRGADYDFARDRYDAQDLTAACRHITKGGITQLAHQRVPYPLLYGVRGDGQIVVHPKSRLQIKGFARLVLGGNARCLSAVSIVGEDGLTDELWLLIERQRGGTTLREIWKQAAWRELGDDQAEAFYVDGGVRQAASANQTSFSGLTHLAGQAVAVLANGAVVPNITVSGAGSFTLPAEAVPDYPYTLVVGLPFTARAISLRPEVKVNGQTSQGFTQRVVKVVTRLLETLGIWVRVPGDVLGEELIDRPANADMDHVIPLFSGDAGGSVEAQFDREGRAEWIVEDPLPAIITGAVLHLDVSSTDA